MNYLSHLIGVGSLSHLSQRFCWGLMRIREWRKVEKFVWLWMRMRRSLALSLIDFYRLKVELLEKYTINANRPKAYQHWSTLYQFFRCKIIEISYGNLSWSLYNLYPQGLNASSLANHSSSPKQSPTSFQSSPHPPSECPAHILDRPGNFSWTQ